MTTIPPMRPEPARDRWGRYLLADPRTGETRGWTRATTLAHTLSDAYALHQWRRRKVAEGLAGRPDLLSRAGALAAELDQVVGDWRAERPLKVELDALCDEAARAAGAESGSEVGTALHALAEYADAGRLGEVDVPPALAGDLGAYLAGMDAAGIERPPEWIERVCVTFQTATAGTFDRLVWVPGRDRLVVADLKTQKTVDFGFLEPAIQLAQYAYSDCVQDPVSGELVAMPPVDREVALLLHLPVGKARLTIYEVDLTEGWAAAVHAAETRGYRERARSIGWPWSGPRVDASRLLDLIGTAVMPEALDALWRAHREVWTGEHTQAASARKSELAGAACRK